MVMGLFLVFSDAYKKGKYDNRKPKKPMHIKIPKMHTKSRKSPE